MQLRETVAERIGMSRNDFMNAESCERLATSIDENASAGVLPVDERSQHGPCGRPERTETDFISLAMKPNKRLLFFLLRQRQVFNGKCSRFLCARQNCRETVEAHSRDAPGWSTDLARPVARPSHSFRDK